MASEPQGWRCRDLALDLGLYRPTQSRGDRRWPWHPSRRTNCCSRRHTQAALKSVDGDGANDGVSEQPDESHINEDHRSQLWVFLCDHGLPGATDVRSKGSCQNGIVGLVVWVWRRATTRRR